MAKTPTQKEVEKLTAQSEAQEQRKLVSQEKQGKDFVNQGQGVIPESVWKDLPGKTLEDEQAVA